MSKRPTAKGKAVQPQVTPKEPSAWSHFVPSNAQLNTLKAQNRTLITQDVVKYMNNPAHHPDLTASLQTTRVAITPKGSTPIQTTTSFKHVDGFEKAPLYQSTSVHVETNMTTRIGGRGLIATTDIQPGTLLLCEYIRHPFEQNVQADDGTPIRSEVEFVQQFCFDMSNTQRMELLADVASLFPFVPEEIDPDHKEFLKHIYGDFLEQCLDHITSIKAEQKKTLKNENDYIDVTEDMLLRLICIVHFNSFPSGILLHTSMINHNCQPNTVKLFIPRPEIAHNSREYAKIAKTTMNKSLYQPKELSRRVYSELRATTLIKKGEEIYISYIPSHLQDLTVNQRQSYLHRQFRFDCTCELCGYETALMKSQSHSAQNVDPFATSTTIKSENESISPESQSSHAEVHLVLSQDMDEPTYDFDSGSNTIRSQVNWIDQLTRDYTNFTTGQTGNTIEQQHEAYLKATQDYLKKQSGEELPEDDTVDEVELNDENLMSFRDIYGLPSTVNVQTFILLQAIPILYPYLFSPTTSIIPLSTTTTTTTTLPSSQYSLEQHQLFIKCHKLILMVTKHLLEHIQQDLSIETLSLILYLYMLVSPSTHPTKMSSSSQQSIDSILSPTTSTSPTALKQLLPWSGSVQFSTALIDQVVQLTEDSKGIECAFGSCNNNGTKYLLHLVPCSEQDSLLPPTLISQHPASSTVVSNFNSTDNWTIDCFLQQTFQQLSRLVLPSDIITSHPTLVHISSTSTENSPVIPQDGSEEQLPQPQQPELKQLHVKIIELLQLMAPITTYLLGKFADRTMGSVHLTISTIGLISGLFNAKHHVEQHQLIYSQHQHTTINSPDSTPKPTPMSLFNIQISTTYNDMLFTILYFLQNILPHHSNASKIFRLPVFRDLIGKSPADANRFAEALEETHFKICDLYNNCPIETIVKGI